MSRLLTGLAVCPLELTMNLLLHPNHSKRPDTDAKTRDLLNQVIGFFEHKGLAQIKADDQSGHWYQDFLTFVKEHQVFATLLTPQGYGAPDARWDMRRIAAMSEILGYYGLSYWYTWQVSILGLGPIWMSPNEALKKRTAGLLQEGGIFAFGLSEKEHGADLYATQMQLSHASAGHYTASGDKYYIGNGNKAALVSVFGKHAETGEYVFFAVDSQHAKFQATRKIETSGVRQAYVAAFTLNQYPLTDADILASGDDAWDSALNTVNIGKYQLGWASIGICTHALYEAVGHAARRHLYGNPVTDFPHVKVLLTEAYTRLIAMKLFALRACDYMRSASSEDRRYLLYNPIQKMKVTMEGELVVELLHQVIAAKGFEQDTYFEMAIRDIGMLPKLEGTVHVNVALVTKFMQNFLFLPKDYPPVPKRDDATNDSFLFNQGPTKGLGKVSFHDYRLAFAGSSSANRDIFLEQVAALSDFLKSAPPSPAQSKNLDYTLQLGELFTLVPYAQLIAENQRFYPVGEDTMELIYRLLITDFSRFAVRFYCSQDHDEKQQALILKMVRKPQLNEAAFDRVWAEQVYPLKDAYKGSAS
ncbi:MAG: acyl-CoA dehydrogenase [Proteobacteria bacterium]|nr:acyl-CoA dehydrogenase [Pseudomonadota bacterium]